nr:Uncharacterised protein [Klebsiella pneumoniae]
MSLLSDDEPERNLLAEAFPLDEEFLPALSGPDAPVNPARAYLLSLNSPAAGRPWPRSSGSSPGCSGP